jgi:hypothetical protein
LSTLAPHLKESLLVLSNLHVPMRLIPKVYRSGCIIVFAFRGMVMPDPACQHKHTQLIAKDDETQYVECLDCGEIFEVGELNDGSGSGESLSDA